MSNFKPEDLAAVAENSGLDLRKPSRQKSTNQASREASNAKIQTQGQAPMLAKRRSPIDASSIPSNPSLNSDTFGGSCSFGGDPIKKESNFSENEELADSHIINMPDGPQEANDGSMMVPTAVGPRIVDRDGLTKEEQTLKSIEEAKELMNQTLQKAIARGEKLESVEAGAELLKMQTAVFHTDAQKTSKKIKWLEHRSKIICASVAGGVILVLFLLAVIASKLR